MVYRINILLRQLVAHVKVLVNCLLLNLSERLPRHAKVVIIYISKTDIRMFQAGQELAT